MSGVRLPQPLLMKIKFNRKTIFIIIGIALVGFLVWQGFFKKEKSEFSLFEVTRGNISQEVSETGTVKVGEEIGLGFKNAGRLEKIYVEVGDAVGAGQSLARIETIQLQIQLQEAQATLSIAQAKLDKLLAGSNAEEIQLSETVLNNAYQDAINYIGDADLNARDAFLAVSTIQRTYFTGNDQEGLNVRENKARIEEEKNQIESFADEIQGNPTHEEINEAILSTENSLKTIIDALINIRDIINGNPIYRDTVSSTDKTSLDTQISNINTAKTEISSAKGAIKKAEDELSIKKASPRQEDVDLYRAQVIQAEAEVNILKEQISDSTLKSPLSGTITKVGKRVGETIQPALVDTVISLLPANPFQIEVDIYEQDIVKVKEGDPVDVKLTAFPNQIFSGKVILIDPAEKLIEGIVYYEVNIDFQNPPSELKPGMTADITIKTAQKENVLILPETAISEKNGVNTVQILNGENLEEKEIEIGLKGNNDMIEVVSGLSEGNQVVIEE